MKQVNVYLQRSKELSLIQPKISHYCKLYAVNLLLKKHKVSPADPQYRDIAKSLISELEEAKSELDLSDKENDHKELINFATRIFINACNEEHSKEVTDIQEMKSLSRKFIAAANFYEVSSVLVSLTPQIIEKIKYAKYKASTVLKSTKMLESTPCELIPPPQEDIETFSKKFIDNVAIIEEKYQNQDVSGSEDSTPKNSQSPSVRSRNSYKSGKSGMESSQKRFSTSSSKSSISDEKLAELEEEKSSAGNANNESKTPYPEETTRVSHRKKESISSEESQLSAFKRFTEAEKYAKYAVSAIQYEDVKGAINNLKKALEILKLIE